GHNCIISVARAAVEHSQEFFPDLPKRKVLVIGAGRLAESMVRELHSAGVKDILLTNRTSQRLELAASRLKVQTIPYEQRWSVMAEVDVVASATTARRAIITSTEISGVMQKRMERPLA